MAAVTHEGLIDLAAARVGGRALAASDEFFAPRHSLLAAGGAVFIEGKYTDCGKWMDGWETRRRRGPEGGYDWCLVRLGIPGTFAAAIAVALLVQGISLWRLRAPRGPGPS